MRVVKERSLFKEDENIELILHAIRVVHASHENRTQELRAISLKKIQIRCSRVREHDTSRFNRESVLLAALFQFVQSMIQQSTHVENEMLEKLAELCQSNTVSSMQARNRVFAKI